MIGSELEVSLDGTSMSRVRVRLVPILGYELYRSSNRETPMAVIYVAELENLLYEGFASNGIAIVKRSNLEKMKSVRFEELAQVVDQGQWSKHEPALDVQGMLDYVGLRSDAPMREFLVRVGEDSPFLSLSIVAEYRTFLRRLVAPYSQADFPAIDFEVIGFMEEFGISIDELIRVNKKSADATQEALKLGQHFWAELYLNFRIVCKQLNKRYCLEMG